jgi:two-component system, OmpR family, KDP operon response regulator KdpE
MTQEPAAGALVLLVEDDAPTRREVATYLRLHGFRVQEAADGTAALERWGAGRPDLILLDLGLPDLDGTTVIRRVRREASTPIVVLSARDRDDAKVAALEQGADDFVAKPFSPAELVARLRAVLRRAAGPAAEPSGELRLGALSIDVARHAVSVGGRPVHLTAREFEVLKVLAGHAGRLVTHGRLLRAVWGTPYADEAHYVHVYVSRIRRKLAAADPDGILGDLIVAEPGVGYRVRMPEGPGS